MEDISKYYFWKEMNAPEEKFEKCCFDGKINQQQGKLVSSPLLACSCVFRAVLQKQHGPLYFHLSRVFISGVCVWGDTET